MFEYRTSLTYKLYKPAMNTKDHKPQQFVVCRQNYFFTNENLSLFLCVYLLKYFLLYLNDKFLMLEYINSCFISKFGRCILVDENDHVVGHESKYNCKLLSFFLPCIGC